MSMSLIGKEVEGYKFEDLLGQGGFGKVYKVSKDGKHFAVKEIACMNDDGNKTAEMEIAFANQINIQSPFLVKYISTFRKENMAYFVMELCPEGDLDNLIKKKLDHGSGVVLSENRLMKVVIQLLLGIFKLHDHKMLHRDIKGGNVFISTDDNVKIGDFGCMKIFETTMNQNATTFVGTLSYMAPEVLQSIPYNYSADVWSLGVLFYYLISGKQPFTTNEGPNVVKIVNGEYDPLTDECHPALRNMIYSMLSTNPVHRPSVLDLLKNPYIQQFADKLSLKMFFPPGAILAEPVEPSVSATAALAPAAAAPAGISSEMSEFIDTLAHTNPEFSVGDFRRAFVEATDRQATLMEIGYFVRRQKIHHPKQNTNLNQNPDQVEGKGGKEKEGSGGGREGGRGEDGGGGGGEEEEEEVEEEEEGREVGGMEGEGDVNQSIPPHTPPAPPMLPFNPYAYIRPPGDAPRLYEEAKAAHSLANLGGGNLTALEEVGRLYQKAATAAVRENNYTVRSACERKAKELSRGQLLYNDAAGRVLGDDVAAMQISAHAYGMAERAALAENNHILARKCERGRKNVNKIIEMKRQREFSSQVHNIIMGIGSSSGGSYGGGGGSGYGLGGGYRGGGSGLGRHRLGGSYRFGGGGFSG